MKSLRIIILLTFLFPATVIAGDKVKTIDIRTRINCDHCRQCGSCGDRLEKALYVRKGVKRVDIDEDAMKIRVAYNTEKISEDDIRNAIAAAGYDADDVKALPEAVAALDDCCKGAE